MVTEKISKKDFKLYLTVIIIAISIVSALLIYNLIVNQQKVTSFYILDENGGYDFPKEVQVNGLYNVTVSISNFEQKTMLYRVYMKVGNLSSNISATNPTDFYVNSTYFESVLSHWQYRTHSISLNMTTVQNHTKLIAELWEYNEVSNIFVYSGQFLFVHYNVTT